MRPNKQPTKCGAIPLTTAAVLGRDESCQDLLPSQRSDLVDGVKRRLGHNPYNEAAEQVSVTQLAINCPRSCVIQTLE